MAVGLVCGVAIFLLTAYHLLLQPEPAINLGLLSQYFPGYSVSWLGGLAGLGWGFMLGFCAGWFLAWVRNLSVALWIFLVRSRYEMTVTRDFLDKI